MAVGIEERLWKMADKLRSNMEASEYKHILLGLLFLKYISDRFESLRIEIIAHDGNPEDRDEYIAENVFFVPEEARWKNIQNKAKDPQIGKTIDDALRDIEKENDSLKGVLDKRYARAELSPQILGGVIDLVSNTTLYSKSDTDILGRVYEYFLGKFALTEGKGGGEFYTPACIVKTLVNMLEPYEGRVYDPCCGSGGMFVQSSKFITEHAQSIDNISVYGQESNPTTWRLCKINLAIRGIEGNIGLGAADTLHEDIHPRDKFDYILANPPFNISDWDGDKLTSDSRWRFGTPPVGNANYAWLQHVYHHLSANGTAGVVLANGSLSSNTSNESTIRRAMLEGDCIDAIVALPTQLFYSTQIPVCLWIMNKNKSTHHQFRERTNEVLFIDARNMGEMVSRSLKELTNEDILKIADTYHQWRNADGTYQDIQGFCKSSSLEEIKSHDYTLTPGRYVGTVEVEDTINFEEEITRLNDSLVENFRESALLQVQIEKHLRELLNGKK